MPYGYCPLRSGKLEIFMLTLGRSPHKETACSSTVISKVMSINLRRGMLTPMQGLSQSGIRMTRTTCSPEKNPMLMSRLKTDSLDLILQPRRSSLCGQAVVAMLLGVSLDNACELVGHKRQTWTRDVVKALRSAGWKVPNKRVTIGPNKLPTDPCLVNIKWAKHPSRHWVVLWNEEIYCSLGLPTEWYKQYEGTLVKSMSFLPLTPPTEA